MDEPSSPEGNPITLRIKFKSASLNDFVARYGADVSAGGIFVRTKQPLAVGALLRFDFSLADGSPLMAGLGTVVWVREPDPSRVGSIPGMGLRFDQLAPESQQTHQQILAAKARLGERTTGTPPQSFAAVPTARPAARPATLPASPPRPAPAPPAAARPSSRAEVDPFDEFSSGGKTEIADRPPSFYFDSPDGARGAPAGVRQAEEAAPKAALEDTKTDSQPAVVTDPSWSEAIDISEAGSEAVSSPGAAAAQARAAGSGQLPGARDELAPEGLDLQLGGSAEPAPVADLSPSPGPGASGAGASPVKPAAEQSWLHRAMSMGDGTSAAPVEMSTEHTEEVAGPPEGALAEAPASGFGQAGHPVLQDMEAFGQDVSDRAPKRPVGQGKKLIVVGILAAGFAFAGVYLLQVKPWQTSVAPVARPTPAIPAPSPVATPPVGKVGEPGQPVARPMPPAAEAKPVRPAQTPPATKPTEAPAKTKPEVTEAAKPSGTGEAAKHPGSAAGMAKKTASKPAPSPPPSSPGAAAPAEIVYLVKVRSVPSGAQVLIDGEPMGQTPFQRRILDTDKTHTVAVRKPGYLSYESSISLSSPWMKDGNTATMYVVAKLKKTRGQSAAPEAKPELAPEQPEKL